MTDEINKWTTGGAPSYCHEEREDWAMRVIFTITEDHIKALDILGWKIVCKDDPDQRWHFDDTLSETSVPDWCDS